METDSLYVFLIAVPADMEKNQDNKQDIVINKMLKDLRYVSQWIEGELFRLHYHYFYSYNQAVIKLGNLAEEHEDLVKIIPTRNHTLAHLIIQIGSRRGYLYDNKSAFHCMMNDKIENSQEV